MDKKTTIKDGHELKALVESCWGESGVKMALASTTGYYGDTDHSGDRFAHRFFVNFVPAPPSNSGEGKLAGTWQAWTPYRSVVYEGATQEQAIATMLHGVARLAYDGSMHPDRPSDMGAPPIQHLINILTERLTWQAARREEAVHDLNAHAGPGGASPDTKTNLVPGLERNNQIIAALGTAIAALARVNDL